MTKYSIFSYIFLRQNILYSVTIQKVYLLNILNTVKFHVYWTIYHAMPTGKQLIGHRAPENLEFHHYYSENLKYRIV